MSTDAEQFEAEEIEIETHATKAARLPKARRYIIRIDKTKYTVDVAEIVTRSRPLAAELVTRAGLGRLSVLATGVGV